MSISIETAVQKIIDEKYGGFKNAHRKTGISSINTLKAAIANTYLRNRYSNNELKSYINSKTRKAIVLANRAASNYARQEEKDIGLEGRSYGVSRGEGVGITSIGGEEPISAGNDEYTISVGNAPTQSTVVNENVVLGEDNPVTGKSRMLTDYESKAVALVSAEPSMKKESSNNGVIPEVFVVKGPEGTAVVNKRVGIDELRIPSDLETKGVPQRVLSGIGGSTVKSQITESQITTTLFGIGREFVGPALIEIGSPATEFLGSYVKGGIELTSRKSFEAGSTLSYGPIGVVSSLTKTVVMGNNPINNINELKSEILNKPLSENELVFAGTTVAIAGAIASPYAAAALEGAGAFKLGYDASGLIAEPSFRGLGETALDIISIKNIGRIGGVLDYATAKINPRKQFYVEKLGAGTEPHKGEGFQQFRLVFKGETIEQPSTGRTFGVTRTKTGQFKSYNELGQDVLLRDVPSEFSTSKTELSLGGSTQTIASAGPDVGYLLKASKTGEEYRVTYGGGKELEVLKGRASVGGSELGKFYSAETQKPTIAGDDIISPGEAQAYIYYTGITGSESEGVTIGLFGTGNKPGIEFSRGTVSSIRNPDKGYVELSQELGFKSGETVLSSSTVSNIRSELEVIKPVGTRIVPKKLETVSLPGGQRLSVFYSSTVADVTEAEKIATLNFNIAEVNKRISLAEKYKFDNPLEANKADIIITTEKNNLLLLNKRLSNIKGEDINSNSFKYEKVNDYITDESYYSSKRVVNPLKRFSNSESISNIGMGVSLLSYDYSNDYKASGYSTSGSSVDYSTVSSNSISKLPSNISMASSTNSYLKSDDSSVKSISDNSRSSDSSRSVRSSSISSRRSSSSISSYSNYYNQNKQSSIISRIKSSTRKSKIGRLRVSVRRKGRFITIGTGLTKEQALRLGTQTVKGTSAATFRIEGTREKIVAPNQFYEKETGTFIELNKYRINTPGEYGQITQKGILSRRKGGFKL